MLRHMLETYNVCPCFQNNVANITADKILKIHWSKLYEGFLQYDKCCFHRQALNCSQPFCGKRVGKCKSLEPRVGVFNCLTSSLLSLQQHGKANYNLYWPWPSEKVSSSIFHQLVKLTCKWLTLCRFVQN